MVEQAVEGAVVGYSNTQIADGLDETEDQSVDRGLPCGGLGHGHEHAMTRLADDDGIIVDEVGGLVRGLVVERHVSWFQNVLPQNASKIHRWRYTEMPKIICCRGGMADALA